MGDQRLIKTLSNEEESRSMPPAQSIIIRCKDCRWRRKNDKVALFKCSLFNFYPTEDWFCAGAERK